jgi:hypothetical protein
VEFDLTFMPVAFNAPHKTNFDTEYMQKLFELGFGMAKTGYSWYKEPPVLLSHDTEVSPASR